MLKNYLLIALRNFRKNKVFSFINVLGLTLGIACSISIFMIVRYELSFDNFHAHPDRIYRIVSEFRYPEQVEYQAGVPYPLPAAFKQDYPQAEQVSIILGAPNTQISMTESAGRLTGSAGAGPVDNSTVRRFREKDGIFYTDPAFFLKYSISNG